MFSAKVALVEKVHYSFKDGKVYDGYKLTIPSDVEGHYLKVHTDKELKVGDTVKVGVRQYGNNISLFVAD